MTDAAAHFVARPDGRGGVRLSLRQKFRDADAVELGDDGIARKAGEAISNTSEAIERNRQNSTDDDENGNQSTRNVIHVFGPLTEGQSYEFEEYPNGTIGVVLVSPPDEILGNSTLNNSGVVGDRRSRYLAKSYGANSEARKLAAINAANKSQYKR